MRNAQPLKATKSPVLQELARPAPASHKTPVLRGLVRPVLTSSVFFMVVAGLGYPLLTTGVAQLVLHDQANGSLVQWAGRPVGSAVIGQNFAKPEYFHPRPSVTQGTDPKDATKTVDQPYNAGSSAASNFGPISKKLLDQVSARAQAYRGENGLAADAPVPVDAVTASASGLDPDISVANAKMQAARVAKARGLSADEVMTVIDQETSRPDLGVFGDPRVNVLKLNLALDSFAEATPAAAQPAAH